MAGETSIDTSKPLEGVMADAQAYIETSAKNALKSNALTSGTGLNIDVGAKTINTASAGPGKINPPAQ
jgi:hypothetical protein